MTLLINFIPKKCITWTETILISWQFINNYSTQSLLTDHYLYLHCQRNTKKVKIETPTNIILYDIISSRNKDEDEITRCP